MSTISLDTSRKPFLERLIAWLRGGDGHAPAQAARPALDGALTARLQSISAEQSRLKTLIEEEEASAAENAARLEKLDKERVSALTAARLEGNASHQERAAALHAQAISLRTSAEDSRAVAGRLRERLEQLRAERHSLRFAYTRELTAFLDALYERAIARYNELAPEVAEAVLEVAAIRRVMMSYRLGNTNGWNGRVHLPGMRAGEGRTIRDVLDGDSQHYVEEAERRTADVAEAIRAAGFTYGLESE